MHSFQRNSVVRRIALGFGVLIILGAVSGGVSWHLLKRVSTDFATVADAAESDLRASHLAYDLRGMERLAETYLDAPTPSRMSLLKHAHQTLAHTIDEERARLDDARETAAIEAVGQALEAFWKAFVAAGQKHGHREGMSSAADAFEKSVEAFHDDLLRRQGGALADFNGVIGVAIVTVLAVLAVGLAGGIAFSVYCGRCIMTPIASLMDYTQHLEVEAVHVSRLATMGEIAASISHELNQPLMAIPNFAAGCRLRIKASGSDPLGLLPALQRISEEANRAGEIIRAIRGFSKKDEAPQQVIQANRIVDAVVAMIGDRCQGEGVYLHSKCDPRLPEITANPVAIRQILLNLTLNALAAKRFDSAESQEIVIATAPSDDGFVRIEVFDNGIGMAPELQARIFEPFFTTRADGSGLGLALCRRLVRNHRGDIKVESTVGQGTTFTILLPVVAPSPDLPVASSSQNPPNTLG